MKLDPLKTAVLVIDMQNDFTEEGGVFEIPRIREGFPLLSGFLESVRTIRLPIFYTRHTYSPESNVIETRLFPNLAEGGLREGTHGWDINDALKPAPGDTIIDKSRYDAFYKTELEVLLQKRNITNVIIVGTMTEVCCESTARSAMCRDYAVHMVSDLNFTRDSGKHDYALKTIASNFGWALTAEETLSALG